ncbi:outer membrane cobalamin receptor [Desulfosalsimonas propionicica]|uniref:Outer membrane cobalamin receptor n=1 Tax=Desulfosalsimonas propionicica TaxID=332175 RepID=A0A7W0HM92_9BACT|nr:TonB-dependent receptor [Desulfosalsimonas propionicica]MBA2883130.1 outer membrane cobalamin receptor [Desulfosalsimonas propionicica]
MHEKTGALLTGFLCILLAPGWILAQPGSEPVFELGEIVVKGQKTGVEDIAINHEMEQEEIAATGSKTLAQALGFAPGITVTRGSKNEPEISIHGFGTEKSLFLIDGIPFYETYYGKLNLDQIPAEMISKIEITKNAPSVLYGANTQIAVINVVTIKGTEDPTFSFTQEIGENGTYRTALSHGNQVRKVNYWLSYSRRETDGFRMSDDFDPEPATPARPFMGDPVVTEDGGFRNNADSEQDAFWGRVGITPSQHSEYFVSMHMMQAERGNPFQTDEYKVFPSKGDDAGFSNFRRFKNYDDWGIDFSGRQNIVSWLTLRGKLFYHEHEDDYVFYAGPGLTEKIATSTYDDRYVGGSMIADIDPAAWYTGHISVHYKQDIHKDRAGANLPFNELESYIGSVGTEHEFFSDNGLTAVIGASYDWFEVNDAEETVFDENDLFAGQMDLDDTDTSAEFNPMAGLNWQFTDTTRVYGSVAKKTRFPTLNQLYSGNSGNPNLDSEQSINYTLGVQRTFAGVFHLRVEGFYHDISDWISRDYKEDDFRDDVYINVEDVEMKGAEIGLSYTPIPDLSASIDYTYNNAENKSAIAVTEKVAGVPENKFVIGVDGLIPWINARLNLRGIYVDKIYEDLPTPAKPAEEMTNTKDYFTVNGRISKQITEKLTAWLECENLFDKDYESEIGFPAPGRNAIAGLKASF